jgi:transcriptional regulator with XRE-family HTH domain
MPTGTTAVNATEPPFSEEGRSTLYRHVVADARRVGLRVAEIGEIAGVSERAVQNWSSGKSKPDGPSRERLLELKYVIEELSDVYTPEGIEVFLHSRQRALDGKRPVDVLRDGNFEVVLALVDRLAGGPRR